MTTKKKRRVRIQKIEERTVKNVIEVEKAFRRYTAFMKAHNMKPLSKEAFIKDFMFQQDSKIQAVKNAITKYNDKRCPIVNKDCLQFRRLFSLRQSYIDPEKFAQDLSCEQLDFFHNHLKCDYCSRYAVIHKFDESPIEEFKEASQGEFTKGIDEFFETMKSQGDKIEKWENERGFSDVPQGLRELLSSEYAKREQTQSNDPLLEDLKQGFEETNRINSLSGSKLQKWLNEKEEE
jgi:hypothetical protein